MRRLLIFANHDAAPPSSPTEIDLVPLIPAAYAGQPMLATLNYWIKTADGDSGGAVTVDLVWVDPAGKTRQLDTVAVALANAEGRYFSPAVQVNRESESSVLKLTMSAVDVLTSRFGYSLCLLPSVESDMIYLP